MTKFKLTNPESPKSKTKSTKSKNPFDDNARQVLDLWRDMATLALNGRKPTVRPMYYKAACTLAAGFPLPEALDIVRNAFRDAWWVKTGMNLQYLACNPDRFRASGTVSPPSQYQYGDAPTFEW
jgi:hypothetical protein